jgi:nicotinate-nucleotide adenylyltransferase
MSTLGVFGGTFDPIHYGHLRTAFELMQALRLDELRFMPTGDPRIASRPSRRMPCGSRW